MTNEQRVRAVYPEAVCVTVYGVRPPQYRIMASGEPKARAIGHGPSRESAAWADAWRTIERERGKS